MAAIIEKALYLKELNHLFPIVTQPEAGASANSKSTCWSDTSAYQNSAVSHLTYNII